MEPHSNPPSPALLGGAGLKGPFSRVILGGLVAMGTLAALLSGCGGEGEGASEEGMSRTPDPLPQEAPLGPKDGFGLPPTEVDRVAPGTAAPDFSLRSLAGDTVTLSAFRGRQNVILVFYRGHW